MSKRKAAAVEEEEEEDQGPESIEADVMDTKCWLLRVPNELAERWHVSQFRWGIYHDARKRAAAQPSNLRLQSEADAKLKEAIKASSLGRMTIDHSSGRAVGKLEVPSGKEAQLESFQMNLEVDDQRVGQQAPHLRILQETVVHDEDGPRGKLRVMARVSDYWNVQESDKGWKQRNGALVTTRAQNTALIEDEFEKGQEAAPSFIRPLQQHEIAAKSQAAVERRVLSEQRSERKSRDVVRNELFDLFAEAQMWTTKDLRDRTNQPEQHLKDCLQDIAALNERGPNRGKWQLKEEYGGPRMD